MPPNHCLRANNVKGVAPPRPPFGEPHPKGAIERTKLRPLRAAAEHAELLSERQVLEHEVGAGPENCAQGTYQSWHEVHSLTSLTAHLSPERLWAFSFLGARPTVQLCQLGGRGRRRPLRCPMLDLREFACDTQRTLDR